MALETGLQYILLNIALNFGIYLILTLSLNIEVGFTGIPEFGRLTAALVGSIAVGAIIGRVAAALAGLPTGNEFISYNAPIITQVNAYLSSHAIISIALLILSILTAALLGALIGLLTALPAIRLKESYLGITLLSFGEILRTIMYNYPDVIGGTLGIAAPSFFGFTGSYENIISLSFIFLMALFCYFIAERISRSPLGRVMKAVRDSELASQVYGRDIMIVRVYAIMIGSAMAALAGALYSIYTKSVRADVFTRYSWTFLPWAYMMLGGVGNNLGVALGVLILSSARSIISVYKYEISQVIPVDPVWLEYILIGMVIILLTLFRPQGLLPEKPVATISKKELEKIRKGVLQPAKQ
ncbi:MAG: branched-chain amino acid ABC transporter permease [Ignisphaera sp.]